MSRLLDRLEREWLKSHEEETRRLNELRKGEPEKQGHDPYRPYHPIFNPNPQEVLDRLVSDREWQERKPFQSEWDEALAGLQAGLYRSHTALGVAFCRSKNWAAKLVSVVVKQGLMSRADVRASFRGRKADQGQGESVDTPLTFTRKHYGGTKPVTREKFELVFLATHGIGLDMVVRLLRLGCWRSPRELCRECHQELHWVQSLRTFLIRERTLTVGEWQECFQETPWGQITRKYQRERARDGATGTGPST